MTTTAAAKASIETRNPATGEALQTYDAHDRAADRARLSDEGGERSAVRGARAANEDQRARGGGLMRQDRRRVDAGQLRREVAVLALHGPHWLRRVAAASAAATCGAGGSAGSRAPGNTRRAPPSGQRGRGNAGSSATCASLRTHGFTRGSSGRIDKPGDRDFYRLHASKGQGFTFEIEAHRYGSPLDSFLSLQDPSGKELNSNDDGTAIGKDSKLEWTAPAAWDEGVHRHHHLRTTLPPPAGDPVGGRVPLMFNDDILLSVCIPTESQTDYYRNGMHDELLFIYAGPG